ncbi:MerR family DNA-binding transcriptional regulator [Nonomuraea sp. B12E4]|uniref:MerR family DNA-binding transcriptional regulator n=1 Tax=Nonomuraea sp. B12E4 TaxID=3153564 RepID=UPI00325C94C3
MPETNPGLSIGQVAERTGLSVHALRFYEREGILVAPVRRGPGGRRLYSDRDVEWLSASTCAPPACHCPPSASTLTS